MLQFRIKEDKQVTSYSTYLFTNFVQAAFSKKKNTFLRTHKEKENF